MYFVYILHSKTKNRFYTGSTNNIERRIEQHNSGYSQSTKSGIPWEIVFVEKHPDRSSAMKRENQIKRKKNRVYIEKLITMR